MSAEKKTPLAFRILTKLFGDFLIDAAYRGVLGRPPDEAGFLAQRRVFRENNDLPQMLHTLVNSGEFAAKMEVSTILAVHKSAHQSHFKQLAHSPETSKKILLLGNCQVRGLARLFRAMTGDGEVKAMVMLPELVKRFELRDLAIKAAIAESHFIFVHPDETTHQLIKNNFPEYHHKVRSIPKVSFAGFHPDVDYVDDAKGDHIRGPLGDYQSSLAFFAWQNNLSKSETFALFSETVYERLGYFEYWSAAKEMLLRDGELAEFPLDRLFEKWSKRGCWMYSMNHPKLHTLADIARIALDRVGIKPLPAVEEFVDDEMSAESVWPVYPEIGARLGLEGHYFFKRATPFEFRDMPVPMMTLAQFIDESFEAYSKYERSELTCHRLKSGRFEKLLAHIKGAHLSVTPEGATVGDTSDLNTPKNTPPDPQKANPYSGLPDYQFWRRAIERLPASAVNPVVRAGFDLSRECKVATAGSCFAQHISRTLSKRGFNYYVTEGGENIAPHEATRRNFGIFSARFGNLYTARQLLQLIERAYGHFSPMEQSWTRADGKLVDPFRPQIEPDGFDSIEALEQSRRDHFAAVRDMFENLGVFVFTLGLTETWRSIGDGAVFPLAPGVVAGEMDRERYEFVNFNVNDVVTDLQLFIDRLTAINPSAKMILTVSPVPLIATYENQHVLVSTTYSKSVLRAAAGEISKANTQCDYFPSYEIITGNYNRGQYFENDLRSIRQEGVDHVMRIFLSSYANENPASTENCIDQQELMREMARANAVVCDEEAIDTSAK